MSKQKDIDTHGWEIDIPGGKLGQGNCGGWRWYLRVDPSGRTIVANESWQGAGTTSDEWHGMIYTVNVGVDIDGDDLRALVIAHIDYFDAIAEAYLGERWDGRKHRGGWDDDKLDEAESLRSDLQRDIEELPTYWDAGEWLYPARGEACIDAAAALLQGQTIEQWAEEESNINRGDALVDSDELASAMLELVADNPRLLLDASGNVIPGGERLAQRAGVDVPRNDEDEDE